mmetsp:Transcript_25840/g.43952  ORF Transcript_25840/g.43952 Transcript_25840/m.43952 type:complete len:137 (-) Transcript_25840:1081-1491(-)
MMKRSLLVCVVVACMVSVTAGFAVVPQSKVRQSTTTELNIFGNLGDAFKNDDTLGARENAGLKGGPKYNEAVTINGKPVKAVVGQKVKVVANSARVRIPYNCEKGDCGTCMIKMNGRKVKACQMSIPSGKCAIITQ